MVQAPSIAPLPANGTAAVPLAKPKPKAQPPLSVSYSGRDLLTSAGAPILRGIAPNVTIKERIDTSSILLGAHPTHGQPASMLDVSLGDLACTRLLAIGRTSLWWQCPAWGTTAEDCPVETQFLLTKLEDGTHALLLPLIDRATFRATLRAHSDGRGHAKTLGLRVESGASSVSSDAFPAALLVLAGEDPFELISRGVADAAALSGTAKPRIAKTMPESAEVFGWCTWDAFYSKVSASAIMNGLSSLSQGGTPPRLLIIDDGWQQTDVDVEFREAIEGERPAGSALIQSSAAGVQTSSASASGVAGVAAAANGGSSNGTLMPPRPSSPESDLEVSAAKHELQEAAVELFSAEGDPLPEQLLGEHLLEEEDAAAHKAVRDLTGKKRGPLATLKRGISLTIAHIETAFLHFGRHLMETSSSDSWLIKVMAALATGPLRPALLRFFARSSDHTRRLIAIEANAKFAGPNADASAALSAPGGDLAAVVEAIKTRYGVRFVYAWHAMGAFWGGLGLHDPGVAKYGAQLLDPVPTPGILDVDPTVAWVQPVLAGVSLPLNPRELHSDMHAYLSSCGVDGVKVDVQGTIGLAGSAAGGGPSLASTYHASLEDSVQRHFPGNHMINCMCHSTEDLYNMRDTNLARVSDDFYPLRPASHTAHVGNCAFNSLFMGEIVGVDWDIPLYRQQRSLHTLGCIENVLHLPFPSLVIALFDTFPPLLKFHSRHPAALLHATARAVSGGPVYVSDRPGVHDFDILRRLVLPDGNVLRCIDPGRPTADCLFEDISRDNKTVLKVWNRNPVTGVVGVFNVQGSTFSRTRRNFHCHDDSPPTLSTVVRPTDVPTLFGNVSSIVHTTYNNGAVDDDDDAAGAFCAMYSDGLKRLRVVDATEGEMQLTVPPAGSDVVVVSPVKECLGVLFAPIGLRDMLNAGGAVLSVSLEATEASDLERDFGGLCEATVRARGSGELLCYASHRPVKVTVGNTGVDFQYEQSQGALSFVLDESHNGARECQVFF